MTVLPGTLILTKEHGIDRTYVVSKGEVAVVQQDESGRRWTSVLIPGQSFGLMGAGSAPSRVVSARATQASELLTLNIKASSTR